MKKGVLVNTIDKVDTKQHAHQVLSYTPGEQIAITFYGTSFWLFITASVVSFTYTCMFHGDNLIVLLNAVFDLK